MRTERHGTTDRGDGAILTIGVFKLLKGLLLAAVGAGALTLVHLDVADTVMHWVDLLRVDPDNRWIHAVLTRVLSVTPGQLRALGVGTFLYAALLSTEGIGLLMRKRWAEYFTILTTAGLIPLELYELVRQLTAARVMVLVVNAAIVVYLALRVRGDRRVASGTVLYTEEDTPLAG